MLFPSPIFCPMAETMINAPKLNGLATPAPVVLKTETVFEVPAHAHWLAVFHGGLKANLTCRFDGFLGQPVAIL